MAITTYAPGECSVSFLGQTLTGFGDEIVTVKREEETYTKVVGADGEVTYRKSANRSGEIMITVKQTSASMAVLGAIAQRDEIDGTRVGIVNVKDNNGHVFTWRNARLAGYPEDIGRGKEIKDHTWKILCDSLELEFAEQPSLA